MQTPLFISHGAPTLFLEDAPARDFLQNLGAQIARPKAILMVSAHWETARPTVNAVAINDTIHDFHGFPKALYDLRYPAPGSTALAERVVSLLGDAGLAAGIDSERGLDHGAWAPLMLIYPEHDIPVVQLSVQSRFGPGHHLEVGRALAPLIAEDVLIIGSGSFTHDLSSWRKPTPEGEPAWVRDFAEWFNAALTEMRTCDLLAYRHQAPNAQRNHPSEEHLLPLFVALGAAGPNATAERLHSSITHNVLRMDAYAFHPSREGKTP